MRGQTGQTRGLGRDGGLQVAGVRHDGLGQAGDDAAGVGVGQYLGLRHKAGDVYITAATNIKC